jgi:membrane fusion protein (multidrug efflux system)
MSVNSAESEEGGGPPHPSDSSLLRGRFIIMLVAVGVLLGLVVGWNLFKGYMIRKVMSQNALAPETVTTTTAEYSDWQPEIGALGSVRAVRGVDVTTELAGLVRSVRFRSGEDAKEGQVLVELNADTDIAQLRALEAAAELSATVYARDHVQFEAQAISQAQLDADQADLKNRRAQAAAQAATVAKKTLRAPFAGRLGITTVNPGQYLNPGDKVVTLQTIDPIYVDFWLPQQELGRVRVGQKVELTADAYPGEKFTGSITAIDPRVDPATRNFQTEALIGNSAQHLTPGMFAHVAIAAGSPRRYLTLPQTAISYNPYGATVFLAQRTGGASTSLVARQTFVTLGSTRGDQVAVLTGIGRSDQVVTSGQLKLKNGTPLKVDNRVLPKNDPNPAPQEE